MGFRKIPIFKEAFKYPRCHNRKIHRLLETGWFQPAPALLNLPWLSAYTLATENQYTCQEIKYIYLYNNIIVSYIYNPTMKKEK